MNSSQESSNSVYRESDVSSGPTFSEKKRCCGPFKVLIFMCLALFLLGVGAFLGWFYSQKDDNFTPAPSDVSVSQEKEVWKSIEIVSKNAIYKSYRLHYPASWTLSAEDTSVAVGDLTLVSLKKGNAEIQILQVYGGAASCLYPEDPDKDGMYTKFGVYEEFSKGGVRWRRASSLVKDPGEIYSNVCEQRVLGGDFLGITSVGFVSLKQVGDDFDPVVLSEFDQILEKLEILGSTMGVVDVNLCYPSEFIPSGNIVAKNVTSGEKITRYYEGTEVGGGVTYGMALSPGTYVFRFEVGSPPDLYSGYYTRCATTMAQAECSTDEDHALIPVAIKAGETVTDVALCDFYYEPDQEPEF